jgi:predicted AlkP superfamily pyrophosphatase or phosphodiesterase
MESGMSMNSRYQTKDIIVYPDYTNSSVNLVNSLLRHYGCESFHNGIKVIDEVLKQDHKHIFLIILDGMGTKIINNNLPKTSFLRSKHMMDISAVYPCTTVAATTAIQSGKTPIETGWLGWHQYIPDIDQDITLFINTNYHTGKRFTDCVVSEKYLAYESITTMIQKRGIKTAEIYPAFKQEGAASFAEACQRMAKIAQTDERSFTYVYWDQPDDTMHKYGCYSNETKNELMMIDQNLKQLSEIIGDDCLLLITPDHGMIDVEEVSLKQYPLILECLLREVSFETRCNNFFVKEDKLDQFEKEFKDHFPDFVLMSKQEVLAKGLFGCGDIHPMVNKMIGTHIAMATGKRIIKHENNTDFSFKAHHAGLSEDEMIIPLIVLDKAIL